jgi:tetratricopeptide (TPR) repeat protein
LIFVAGMPAAGPGNQAYLEGRYAEAEKYFTQALNTESGELAIATFNLAAVYRAQARYDEAEALYRRVIATRESAFGPTHPSLTTALDGLALNCQSQGHLAEAEELAARAMRIEANPRTLNILAVILADRNKYSQAEALARRADSATDKAGSEHAEILSALGLINRRQKKYEKAESFYRQSAAIFERTEGPESPSTAAAWSNLARVLTLQGHLADAEVFYSKAAPVLARAYGRGDSRVVAVLTNYSNLRGALFVNVAAQSQVPHCRPEICLANLLSPDQRFSGPEATR